VLSGSSRDLGVFVVSGYVQILQVTDDVMVLLLCHATSEWSFELCPPGGSKLGVYRRPGVQLDDEELRRLVLDVRIRTLTCVPTKSLNRVPLNGWFIPRLHDEASLTSCLDELA